MGQSMDDLKIMVVENPQRRCTSLKDRRKLLDRHLVICGPQWLELGPIDHNEGLPDRHRGDSPVSWLAVVQGDGTN